MKFFQIRCDHCKKITYRSKGRINEAQKFRWKTYCSSKCQYTAKNKQQLLKCSNPKCGRIFQRQVSDIQSYDRTYCSRSCAASINNSKFPKRPAQRKICAFCGKQFISLEKYCSKECKDKYSTITKEEIVKRIKDLYMKTGHVPLKREFNHNIAARKRFGSWNKAVKAAGFTPNPVRFARKHFAKDGHRCDSLAEKIIDDWLYERKIMHQRSIPYPKSKGFTTDFVIGEYWIEFFGLHGEHERYDKLRQEKLRLVKELGLKLIELYPKDLFPKNNLEQVFKSF